MAFFGLKRRSILIFKKIDIGIARNFYFLCCSQAVARQGLKSSSRGNEHMDFFENLQVAPRNRGECEGVEV